MNYKNLINFNGRKTNIMFYKLIASFCFIILISCSVQNKTSNITIDSLALKALIIDGQNNHDMWPKTTAMMKSYLLETGMFSVDIARTQYTWKGDALLDEYKIKGIQTESLEHPKLDPDFKPNFSKYDVVISNFGWNAAPWPEQTQKAFEKYIENGGGLVVIHAADNSFPEWAAFNQMIGLGGWGGRTEKDGPYVYYNLQNKLKRDMSEGPGGAHGPQHEFTIQVRKPNHPIVKGLPTSWLHSQDELYDKLRGPAKNMEVIATAYSSEEFKGTERHEPMLMTISYGSGRIYHTPMGHADYSLECVGFITTFQRGTEWAATGKVTQTGVPVDFPLKEKISVRTFGR